MKIPHVPADAVTACLRVRYAECDPMQVAHHANYYVWFELARSQFCRDRGIDYPQMERDGLFLPIVESKCRYVSAAHYDEELRVIAWIDERKKRTVRFHYLVTRGEDLLARGETYQILMDREGNPRTFPHDIAVRFAPERD